METLTQQQKVINSIQKKDKNPFFRAQTIQKKLSIGTSNDPYEAEAEAMADKVVSMIDSQVSATQYTGALVQRKCENCKEDILQKKSLASEITPLVQRKSQGAEAGSASQALTQQINSNRGNGQNMDKGTQNYMESRFGVDFSGVKIHTDAQAVQMNRDLSSKAFTVGNDIYFNEGQYNTKSNSGKHLLAHELTHVVQQGVVGGQNKIQRFVNCGGEEECQERNNDEISRSRNSEMMVVPISNPVEGLLISNFAVGNSELKENFESNSFWANYWGQMITNKNIRWQILGFSDCHGSDNVNTLVRWERAIAVNNALPSLARKKIDGFKAAPLNQCIAGNETEESRRFNRSVLIQQVITEYDFEDGEEIIVCPTPQDWLRRALASAEITMSDWEPSEGFEANRETVMNVYAYYENLYQTNSDLLWAGMAKLAGGSVFGAMQQIQIVQQIASEVMQGQSNILPAIGIAASMAYYYCKRLMKLLLAMQKDIFLDLSWQHQAYIERGLECLELIMDGENIPIEAWRDIASGDSGRVSEGNQTLLRREQEDILSPYYTEIQNIHDMNILPQVMSILSQSPIPDGRPFHEVVDDGDITEFEDRWRWISEDMLPKYENLSEEYRSRLVDTPLKQLADRDFPSEF